MFLIVLSVITMIHAERMENKAIENNKLNNNYKEVPCYDNYNKIIENAVCKNYHHTENIEMWEYLGFTATLLISSCLIYLLYLIPDVLIKR